MDKHNWHGEDSFLKADRPSASKQICRPLRCSQDLATEFYSESHELSTHPHSPLLEKHFRKIAPSELKSPNSSQSFPQQISKHFLTPPYNTLQYLIS